MSERIRYSVIKGVSPDRARNLIDQAARSLPGAPPKNSKWSDWTHVVKPKTFRALACADALVLADDAWILAREVAAVLDAPHLELRVQEGDHWDFTLYHRAEVLADFSTHVAYFNADPQAPRPWKAGNADRFASAWGVSQDSVAPYLIDWGALRQPVIAQPGDKFPAGEWRQIVDFMKVLGIDDPFDNPNAFTFDVPTWQGAYVRQPHWRRAIRRVSVWIKGTYPDVPRHTPAEREEWDRRIASIRVVRMSAEQTNE